MNQIKSEIVKSILEKVKTRPSNTPVVLDPTDLFESVPFSVSHDSELIDGRIEIEVTQTGVKYQYTHGDKDLSDEFDEEDLDEDKCVEFEFNDLTLLQLVLIHEKC
jgi:hypothetical protein